MNLRRIKAISKKEFIQIIRDPRSLTLALFIPIFLIFLFGYGLSLDIENVPIAVWDQDNSQTSRDFLLNFSGSNYFDITGYYDNYKDLEWKIDKGETLMAMVIPKDFSKDLHSGQAAPLQLILDGSDSNTANISLGYVSAVVLGYNTKIISNLLKAISIVNPTAIALDARVWFNPDFQSKNFVIPGLVAVIMMIISALLTSLTVAREWERGTMEQLIATPVRGAELIYGKFIPYFVIGMIDLLFAVLMGKFMFGVPLRGSVILLFFVSAVFLTGALGLGIFISVVAKNQLMASQLAMLSSFLPTFLLSGFTYEIFNMPPVIQAITYFVPARYFIKAVRGIYLKSVGLEVLWPQMLCLIAFAFFMMGLAVKKFKKEIT